MFMKDKLFVKVLSLTSSAYCDDINATSVGRMVEILHQMLCEKHSTFKVVLTCFKQTINVCCFVNQFFLHLSRPTRQMSGFQWDSCVR